MYPSERGDDETRREFYDRCLIDGWVPLDHVKVPMAIVTGQYEKLTEDELAVHEADLHHERQRRAGAFKAKNRPTKPRKKRSTK